MTAYPLLASRRDKAGHDAGRIHYVRRTLTHHINSGAYETACGLRIGLYGIVTHQIGPTCTQCRRLAR